MKGKEDINFVEILGVKVTNTNENSLNQEIKKICSMNCKVIISNVNIHAMNLANSLTWFKDFLNRAYINFCDGDGVRLGAKILGYTINNKITYNRWIWNLAEFSQAEGLSWFLIGSHDAEINKAFQILRLKYPNLKVVGFRNGYFNGQNEIIEVIDHLMEVRPNILILGMGMPVQEKFLFDNFHKLTFNVALTGGAVFDYISGKIKITPKFYYYVKLEWFYRFLQDPKRLFVRYFWGNLFFMFRILLHRFKIKGH